jgi:DNA-directed RNA polymerase subunit M/transcription elongation factor TFIIS
MITVPAESRSVGTGYEVHEGETAPHEAVEIAFACSVCRTRLTAEPTAVGQLVECPDCRTKTPVPATSPLPPPALPQQQPAEAYSICIEFDPAAPVAAQADEIRVYCALCHTMMYAPVKQIGGRVTCPDCGTQTMVLPPKESLAAGDRFCTAADDVYEVDEAAITSDDATDERYVGFKCKGCGSRLVGARAAVGAKLRCHDCGTDNTVPPFVRKLRIKQEDAGEYAAEPGHELPVFRPIFIVDRRRFGRTSDRVNSGGAPDASPVVPRWPMVSGVFAFPWRGNAWPSWLGLSTGFGVTSIVTLFAIVMWFQLDRAGDMVEGFASAVIGICLAALAAFLLISFTFVLAVNAVTILCDTAAGNDEVVEWPSAMAFVEWFGSTFFILAPLAYAISLGALIAWTASFFDRNLWWAVPLSVLFTLPFLLLSALEKNSPLLPYSPAVARSLWRQALAWLLFYVESTATLALAVLATALAAQASGPMLALLVGSTLGMAATMIYLRLLGRLAWCCGRTMD